MKWFRFYSEVLDNPKVQRLPGDLFKAWVNLLCLANRAQDRGVLPPVEDIAFALRISDDEAARVVEELRRRGLLDECDGQTEPHDWGALQPDSDTPEAAAERKRRQRDREKKAAARHSDSHAEVTVQKRLEEKREEEQPTVAKATGGEPPEEEEPAGEPERPGTPPTPNRPDPEAEFRRHRADIAGAIREHAWLRRAPPPIRRRGGQPWEMDNELSIAKELLKQFTAEELIGGIQFWRRTHGTPEGEQFSLAFCYKDGERWKISLAVDSWQHAEEDGAPVVDLLAKLKLGGHDAAA